MHTNSGYAEKNTHLRARSYNPLKHQNDIHSETEKKYTYNI